MIHNEQEIFIYETCENTEQADGGMSWPFHNASLQEADEEPAVLTDPTFVDLDAPSESPILEDNLLGFIINVSRLMDGRKSKGKTHPMEEVVISVLVGYLCGYNSYRGINAFLDPYGYLKQTSDGEVDPDVQKAEQEKMGPEEVERWRQHKDKTQGDAKKRSEETLNALRECTGLPFRAGIPTYSNMSRCFASADQDLLGSLAYEFFASLLPEDGENVFHIDGKALRGALSKKKKGHSMYLINVLDKATQLLLYSFEVGSKTNEAKQLGQELANILLGNNATITADAASSQKGLITLVAGILKGNYCLPVKANQQKMQEYLLNLMAALGDDAIAANLPDYGYYVDLNGKEEEPAEMEVIPSKVSFQEEDNMIPEEYTKIDDETLRNMAEMYGGNPQSEEIRHVLVADFSEADSEKEPASGCGEKDADGGSMAEDGGKDTNSAEADDAGKTANSAEADDAEKTAAPEVLETNDGEASAPTCNGAASSPDGAKEEAAEGRDVLEAGSSNAPSEADSGKEPASEGKEKGADGGSMAEDGGKTANPAEAEDVGKTANHPAEAQDEGKTVGSAEPDDAGKPSAPEESKTNGGEASAPANNGADSSPDSEKGEAAEKEEAKSAESQKPSFHFFDSLYGYEKVERDGEPSYGLDFSGKNVISVVFEGRLIKMVKAADGRFERREYEIFNGDLEFSKMDFGTGFDTVQAVGMVTRYRLVPVYDPKVKNTVYKMTITRTPYIMSQHMTVEEFAVLSRSHWSIEQFHYELDTIYNEDKCTTRKNGAPIILSQLRKIAMNVTRFIGANWAIVDKDLGSFRSQVRSLRSQLAGNVKGAIENIKMVKGTASRAI